MRYLFLFLILFLTSCACATKPTGCLHVPPDPIPATESLNELSSPDEVLQAWVTTAYQYRNWDETVRKQIELCR